MDSTGVIVVTGNGKGKTTNALGYALMALGQGHKVTMTQFQKGSGYSGELFVSQYFDGRFVIKQFGAPCPISAQIKSGELKCRKCGYCFRTNKDPRNDFAQKALAFAVEAAKDTTVDVLILDEVSHAIKNQLIKLDDVLSLVNEYKQNKLIILTGRDMPQALCDIADRVTSCDIVKHPMRDRHIDARRGIEY